MAAVTPVRLDRLGVEALHVEDVAEQAFASSMSTRVPVTPPAPKLPCTPRSRMSSFTYIAVAIDTPPAPVWSENPSHSRPEAAMTCAALDAICNPTASVVGRVVPERMPAGSPIESTTTTKSTSSWGMSI